MTESTDKKKSFAFDKSLSNLDTFPLSINLRGVFFLASCIDGGHFSCKQIKITKAGKAGSFESCGEHLVKLK